MIYLDCAASNPIRENIVAQMSNAFLNDFANPHAAHRFGKECGKKIQKVRDSILNFFDLKNSHQLMFTGSASEANNFIIKQYLKTSGSILYCRGDHPSVYQVIDSIYPEERRAQFSLNQQGLLDQKNFEEKLNEIYPLDLVCLTWVNNQIGTELDLDYAIQTIKKFHPKAWIHVDGVQAIGKSDQHYSILKKIDSLTISAHKIRGPKGIGAVLFRDNSLFEPLVYGGGQEFKLRSGTLSYPLILGFGMAIEQISSVQELSINKNELIQKIKDISDRFEFPFYNGCSPIVAGFFHGVSSDILMRHLETKDIFISSSSACSSKIKGKSDLLELIGFDQSIHKFFFRLSYNEDFKKEDMALFIEKLNDVYNELKFLLK